MDRAVSRLLVLKTVNDNTRTIEGVASTPSPDSFDDIVEPTGARYKLPLALLWQHDHARPVGKVEFAATDPRGIGFRATLAKCDEPGLLHDRLEEAWHSIKTGLVRGVSIGFRPLKMEPRHESSRGMRYLEWQWLELSCVTIPANADASITAIRSADSAQRQIYAPFARVVRLTPTDWQAKTRN